MFNFQGVTAVSPEKFLHKTASKQQIRHTCSTITSKVHGLSPQRRQTHTEQNPLDTKTEKVDSLNLLYVVKLIETDMLQLKIG